MLDMTTRAVASVVAAAVVVEEEELEVEATMLVLDLLKYRPWGMMR